MIFGRRAVRLLVYTTAFLGLGAARSANADVGNEWYKATYIFIGWWCSGDCNGNPNCCVVID